MTISDLGEISALWLLVPVVLIIIGAMVR
jgi:hypothetical protein